MTEFGSVCHLFIITATVLLLVCVQPTYFSWDHRRLGRVSRSLPVKNLCEYFYRPNAIPVSQSTVRKHWRNNQGYFEYIQSFCFFPYTLYLRYRCKRSFSSLTLLVGWLEGHPACKNCVDMHVCVCVGVFGVCSWLVCGTAAIHQHSPLSLWQLDRWLTLRLLLLAVQLLQSISHVYSHCLLMMFTRAVMIFLIGTKTAIFRQNWLQPKLRFLRMATFSFCLQSLGWVLQRPADENHAGAGCFYSVDVLSAFLSTMEAFEGVVPWNAKYGFACNPF